MFVNLDYTFTYAYICIHKHSHTHTYTHPACTHTHTHKYTHTLHARTHIHTHKHLKTLFGCLCRCMPSKRLSWQLSLNTCQLLLVFTTISSKTLHEQSHTTLSQISLRFYLKLLCHWLRNSLKAFYLALLQHNWIFHDKLTITLKDKAQNNEEWRHCFVYLKKKVNDLKDSSLFKSYDLLIMIPLTLSKDSEWFLNKSMFCNT